MMQPPHRVIGSVCQTRASYSLKISRGGRWGNTIRFNRASSPSTQRSSSPGSSAQYRRRSHGSKSTSEA
eukprot:6184001-Prorocentrum_lima.AAC.1